jgi:hypothetical protein
VECILCKRIHEHDNTTLFIAGEDQKVYFKCYRANDDPTVLVKTKWLITLKPELSTHILNNNPKKIRAGTVYNNQHVKPLESSVGVITLVSSYLGTGKTIANNNFIRAHNYGRVLIISPRRLYAISMGSEYNKSGNNTFLLPFVSEEFQCYLNESNVSQYNRLTLQMESLYKVNNAALFHVLILDEIEALLTQFSSPTMTNKIKCAEIFEKLIKETPYIIGGDAFLQEKTKTILRFFTTT